MRRHIFIYIITASLLLAATGAAQAATITAQSPSYEDVNAAVSRALDGDTVMIPAGNYTWSSTLTLNKSITLKGMGGDSTKISYGIIPVIGDVIPMVNISLLSDKPVRITGIYFDMVVNNVNGGPQKEAIRISGNRSGAFGLTQIRIDHNTFNKGGRQIHWKGWAYGVIDHNTFVNGDVAVGLTGDNNNAWTRPIAPGTADAVFIEDNTFTINNDAPCEESNHLEFQVYHQEGARSVVRNNIFDASTYTCGFAELFDSHGNGNFYRNYSDFRGQPMIEVYNNTFHAYKSYGMTNSRGGSMLIYNNTYIIDSSGTLLKAILLTEEEGWKTVLFNPLKTVWPAEDQINNTFIWNNTFNGTPVTGVPLGNATDSIFIQENRDYWMHAPCDGTNGCNGGKTVYTDRPGGNEVFIPDGPNAYYPYTPYTYPHPLTRINDWQFDWAVRTDRYGKPAGIFDQTPFPITETTTEYSIKNDEFPLGKTYYLGEKYYVDGGYTGGSNDGSWTHPWTSIKTAVANVTSGNKTIIVRGAHDSFNGIYVETGITPKAGTDDAHHFMIVGYGQERPIVDGNYSTQDMIGSTGQLYGYTTVQRLRLQNNSRDGVHWGGTVNGVLQDRDRYNYLIDVDFYNIGANPSYHTNAPIYYLDAPNGWIFHVTVKHTLMHCIKIGDGGDNDLVEWTVAGECGYWPGVAAETGITDFRTQLYQYPRCLDFPNDSGQIAENTIARYNIAYDGLYGGVQIRNSYNFSFHHNEIYNSPRLTVSNMGLSCANVANPCAQVLAIGEPANQVNTPLDKVYMYSNVIRDSGEPIEGAGIGIHSLTDGHTVYLYNNLLYSNPKSEISLYAYTNIVPYPYSSRRVEILNNTLWHGSNYNAALFIPNYSANKWGDEEVAIKNNIITNTASGGYVYGEGGGARSTTNYDYNLYYYPNNGRLGASAGLNDYAHGASTNSLFVAEPFGAYSWGMGNLLPSSPAKDSGLNLSALFTSDFNLASRPQGSAWDIGAYEYVQNLSGDVSGDGVITTYDAGLALQLGRGALEAAQIAQEAVD